MDWSQASAVADAPNSTRKENREMSKFTAVVYTWDDDASNADECISVHHVEASVPEEVKPRFFPAENQELVALFSGHIEDVRPAGI